MWYMSKGGSSYQVCEYSMDKLPIGSKFYLSHFSPQPDSALFLYFFFTDEDSGQKETKLTKLNANTLKMVSTIKLPP